MDWTGGAQLFGYAGTLCFLLTAISIAWYQRTTAFYWVFVALGDAMGLVCGWKLGSPAVILDVLVFLPVQTWGVWRYWAGSKGSSG